MHCTVGGLGQVDFPSRFRHSGQDRLVDETHEDPPGIRRSLRRPSLPFRLGLSLEHRRGELGGVAPDWTRRAREEGPARVAWDRPDAIPTVQMHGSRPAPVPDPAAEGAPGRSAGAAGWALPKPELIRAELPPYGRAASRVGGIQADAAGPLPGSCHGHFPALGVNRRGKEQLRGSRFQSANRVSGNVHPDVLADCCDGSHRPFQRLRTGSPLPPRAAGQALEHRLTRERLLLAVFHSDPSYAHRDGWVGGLGESHLLRRGSGVGGYPHHGPP